jgi:hypothetical protein
MDISEVKAVYLDPRCMINYASYYIYGFGQLLGKDKCHFEMKRFQDLYPYNYENYRKGIAVLIQNEDNSKHRIYIDFSDTNQIDRRLKNWADVYAKINLPHNSPENDLFSIGPSFGISLWNPCISVLMAVTNFLKGRNKCQKDVSFKYFIRDYLYLNFRRKQLSNYLSSKSEDDYCFSLSTLWYDDGTDQTTNTYRGWFVEEASNLYPKFDGGFFYINGAEKQYPKYTEYLKKYQGLLIDKRISMTEYLTKIKKSAVVFNTPSVLGCHGWKLGEYLAMGKAIISTPLTNVMPGDFKKDINYIEVKSRQDIHDAIIYFRDNPHKRMEMEKKNKQYYDDYLSPVSVVKRILIKL